MEGPPYRKIVAEIRRRIDAGELRPGDRVPSARQITADWGVAIATATKVLSTLQQDGLVRAVPGVGTVVAEPESPPSAELERTARRRRAAAPEQALSSRPRLAYLLPAPVCALAALLSLAPSRAAVG
jgi:DNA-binding GntR family transcriptional regulator